MFDVCDWLHQNTVRARVITLPSSRFMYSQTIDDDTASEKTVDTVEVIPAKKLLAALQKDDLILSPENLAQKLGASLRLDPDAQAAKIRRTASSPDLSE